MLREPQLQMRLPPPGFLRQGQRRQAGFDGQTRDPDFTTEGTEAAETGRKGFRIRVQTPRSLRSVSVISVPSVVKSGADSRETLWLIQSQLRAKTCTRDHRVTSASHCGTSGVFALTAPVAADPLPWARYLCTPGESLPSWRSALARFRRRRASPRR